MRTRGPAAHLGTALLLAALTLAACGGSGDDGAASSTDPAGASSDAAATEPSASTGADDPGAPGTIRVGTYLDAMALDPHSSVQGQAVIEYLQPVYDTLVRRTADFTFEPMLATSWEYLDDGKTVLQLSLRDDVVFVDGTPFDAGAVKANLERAQEKQGAFAPFIGAIESVEVVDPHTVNLHLSEPTPTIELGLSLPTGMMVSPAAFEDPDLDVNPVGTGPYLFDPDFFVSGSQWGYDMRDDYWDPALQTVERLELTLITDPEARFNALQSGQIDIGAGSLDQIPDAEASGLDVHRNDVDWLGLIIQDRDGSVVPALGDKRVRQALNHAIDRDAIVDTLLDGNGTVTQQIFGSSSPAYVAELDDAYPYDPDRARELLAEAGYAEGFTITTPSAGGLNTYVEALAGYLAEIGVTLEIETLESGFVAAVIAGDYTTPLMSYGTEHPHSDLENLVLPTGAFNPYGAELPEVAELRTEAAALPAGEAAEKYQEINRIITDEAWFLVTHRSDLVWFTSPDVGNFELYALQAAPAIYGWTIDR